MQSGGGQIGAALREAREARGIELEEVERATKIRVRFLTAIEDERWDVLPGRAYATGFVRTYAEFLELDPAPLLADLHRRLEPGEHEEEVPPEPIVQRGTLDSGLLARIPIRLVATVVGIAAAIALLAVAIYGGESDPVSDPASAPSPVAEEAAPDPDQSADAPGDDPAGGESSEVAEPPPQPERAELVLEAAGTVWVCVVDGRGEALVDGETLAEGESRGPFEARRMLMTFGHGQIELTANGEAIDVPDTANPLGYELTATGVDELEPANRPTCG